MNVSIWLFVILLPLSAIAQDGDGGDVGFRFQPPTPPPLDTATDFEDMDEDSMETGDEGFRPPPLPQNNSFQPPPPSSMPDFRPSMPRGGTSTLSGKVRFEVVDGHFFETGKKRGRGQKLRATESGGAN